MQNTNNIQYNLPLYQFTNEGEAYIKPTQYGYVSNQDVPPPTGGVEWDPSLPISKDNVLNPSIPQVDPSMIPQTFGTITDTNPQIVRSQSGYFSGNPILANKEWGNPVVNVANSAGKLLTGLTDITGDVVGLALDAPDLYKNLRDNTRDLTPQQLLELTGNTANYLGTQVPLDFSWIMTGEDSPINPDRMVAISSGEIPIKDEIRDIANAAWRDPINAGLNIAAFGSPVLKGILGAGKNTRNFKNLVNYVSKGAKAIKQRETAEAMAPIVKIGKEQGIEAVSKAAYQAEHGILPTTPQEVENKNTLKRAMDFLKRNTKERFREDTDRMAKIQYITRKQDISYQQAEKLLNDAEKFRDKAFNKPIETIDDFVDRVNAITGKYTKTKTVKWKEPKTLIKDVDDATAITSQGNLLGQNKTVQNAFSRVFDNEEMKAIKDLNGNELYEVLADKLGGTREASDFLRENGVSGIIDVATGKRTVFGGKANGGYNPKNKTFMFKPNASESTKLHEGMHFAVDELRGVDPDFDDYLRVLTGKTDLSQLTRKDYEIISDVYQDFKAGKEVDGKYLRLFNLIENPEAPLGGQHSQVLKLAKDADDKIKSGDMFFVTHAGDEPNMALPYDYDYSGVQYAGKNTKRVVGQKSYEQIGTDLVNNEAWAEQMSRARMEEDIIDEILGNKTFGGEVISPKDSRDIAYVSRKALESGNLKTVVSKPITPKEYALLSDKQKANYIEISKDLTNQLNDQLYTSASVLSDLGGTPQDLFRIQKQNLLGSGMYLAGNAWTGLTSTGLNSGLGIIDDFLSSKITGGKLTKALGLHRIDTKLPDFNKGWAQAIGDFNEKFGGKFIRDIDAFMQNGFAEMNANAQLRKGGIPIAEREKFLKSLSPKELGEIGSDVSILSLMNQNSTIIPKKAMQYLSPFMPFIQWQDTAVQNAVFQATQNPATATIILTDILGNIGYNEEMQRRTQLGVESDKQGVTYRMNPKTGKLTELSFETIPIMASLRTGQQITNYLSGKSTEGSEDNPSVMGLTTLINTAQGKNAYGNPLQHPNMISSKGHRYLRDPENPDFALLDKNGKPIEVDKATGGEVASGLLSNTISPIKMVNNTILPAAAGAWNLLAPESMEVNYYRPYPSSLFGQIRRQGDLPSKPNFFIGGNPINKMEGRDLMYRLMGGYTREYDPMIEQQQIRFNPQNVRGINRAIMRRMDREQESVNE